MTTPLTDHARRFRNALLGRPAVRDRLSRSAVGARIADAHAARLFATMTGFATSRMLAAAVDLGLLERLAAQPATLAEIAAGAALPPAGARALADAMVACGVWERHRDGRFGLGIDGLVIASDPAVRAMIDHNRLLAADLADPVALLRAPGGGALGAFWPYRGGGDAGGYSRLMAESDAFAGRMLADGHDFGRYTHVMDVGGGEGAFVRTLATRWPHLAITLIDLPPVIDRAREALADLPQIMLAARRPGDTLPRGADAVTLVRVLHDLDDDSAQALLAAAAAALRPRGTLIVAEPMRRRGRDPVAAYFAAYFAAMGSGRLRSSAEIAAMARRAGLRVAPPSRRFLVTTMIAQCR